MTSPGWLPTTDLAHAIYVLIISMVPTIELTGAMPIGYALFNLPLPTVFCISVIGNLLPVPIIIIFIRRIFTWFKKHTKLGKMVEKLETRALSKADKIRKYEMYGLFTFVALPFPGTGVWTGALIAALLDIRLKKALPAIVLGVLVNAIVVALVIYFGAMGVVKWLG